MALERPSRKCLINYKLISLTSYIFNKLLYALIVLFGVVVVIFFLFNIMPADPAKMMLGDRDNAKQLELINEKYH